MSDTFPEQFRYKPDYHMLTVMHTGTTWLKRQLKDNGYEVTLLHCSPEGVEAAPEDAIPCSTWRDPYRTAASWANRRHFRHEGHWERQWLGYKMWLDRGAILFDFKGERVQHGLSLSFEPLNEHEDRFGMHKALDEGNFEHFWSIVPKEAVRHALNCIPEELKQDLVGPGQI